ncbi:hypothetical protein FACS1894105_02600 [Clostridia bacterium]|nr:hypothetical protein FACS1894105_02600 [Clostridia bacterium]
MKITFAVTGEERKTLVTAISEIVGVAPVYCKMPTMNYVVMNITISKVGEVSWDDRTDDATIEKIFDGLEQRGYTFERPTPTSIPVNDAEELGLGRQHRENPQSENGMHESDVPESDRLIIEMPLDGFTPEKLDNLFRLVNSKDTLLKAALGAEDLPIQQTADTLSFPWFNYTEDGGTVNAYTTLIGKLCKTAKEKQRVTAKEHGDVENPKYAMRCYLLSLGFIGPEYKAARKILLNKLSGNSSWKSKQSGVTINE